jgi:MFS family permease
MGGRAATPIDWRALWRSGDLGRFCFISLGIVFHAGCENMITTILPLMVKDLGGVQYTGWSFSIYETGSIIAGAAAGRLTITFKIRTTMIVAALVFALGCLVSVLSPNMPWLLSGRLLSGFGGGALISLTFVATQRYLQVAIWPQLMAILSVVWGIAAFGGPLYGGLFGTLLSWRWAFVTFGGAALLFAVGARYVLRNEPETAAASETAREFPALALFFLAISVSSVAAAGVETDPWRSALLLIAGLSGIAFFFALDARNARSRLFPAATFAPWTTLGSGMMMVGALAVSTCSFGFYGPLLLAGLHNFSPLTTGLIIASESISWSILSILIANASPRREPLIVIGGAFMVVAGIAGFAFAVPSGSIPVILFCALLQGGGFGILWPFASRRIIEAAPDHERNIAASAFSTMQRLGYATGAALSGIIANLYGFSGGFTKEAAAAASSILFLAFIPLALIGLAASVRLARPASVKP